jgi:hypothetical protein
VTADYGTTVPAPEGPGDLARGESNGHDPEGRAGGQPAGTTIENRWSSPLRAGSNRVDDGGLDPGANEHTGAWS